MESALLFMLFCALGLSSMAPGVTFGDSGEFIASAAVLGVAHAPGYPLQALAGRALAQMMPLGSWAYRTNLLSVLAAAAALTFLAAGLKRAGAALPARLGAALLLGLSVPWRLQAGVTEVFSLHLLFLCVLLWFLCRGELWSQRSAAGLGLAAGLALTNHHTALLAAPALALQAWQERKQSNAAALNLFMVFLAVGFSCYLYLPLRARLFPPLDWGHAVDWPSFLHVLLRRDYGSFSLTVEGQAGGLGAAAGQIARFHSATASGLGLAFIGLALSGLVLWPLPRLSRSTILLWVVMTGPFFLVFGAPPLDAQTSGALERFFLAPWLGLAVAAAAGLEALWRRVPAAAWAFLLIPAAGVSAGPAWRQRGDFAAYDYGRNVLRSLPERSVLYMDGGDDTFYTLAFLTYAQGLRPDLELHDRGGLVFKNSYGPDFRRLSRQEKEARRQEVEKIQAETGRLYYSTLNDKLLNGYKLQPEGLLRTPATSPAGAALWEIYPRRTGQLDYRSRAIAAFYPVMRAAARTGGDALLQLRLAWELAPDSLWMAPHLAQALAWLGYEAAARGDWALAEEVYLFAQEVEPLSAQTALNLGLAYERTGRPSEAERLYRQGISLDPRSKGYYNLGALFWAQSRWQESADAFEAAGRIAPSPEAVRYAALARLRAQGRR